MSKKKNKKKLLFLVHTDKHINTKKEVERIQHGDWHRAKERSKQRWVERTKRKRKRKNNSRGGAKREGNQWRVSSA